MNTEHFISKFIQIARNQQLTQDNDNVNECLKNTCKEFVEWCMIVHLKLDFKNKSNQYFKQSKDWNRFPQNQINRKSN